MISLRTGLVYGNLLLLGLTSYHAASFGMERLGSELKRRTLPPSVRAVRVTGQSTRVKVLLREFQPILAANVFKAARTKKAVARQPVTPSGIRPPTAGPSPPVQDPRPNLMLAGTMVFGRRSFAIVADGSGRNKRTYRPGECMPSSENPPNKECRATQSKLLAVLRKSIRVRYLENPVTLILNEKYNTAAPVNAATRFKSRPGRSARPKLPRARPSVASRARPLSRGGVFPSVRRGDSIEVRVPAVEVKKSMENFASVLKQARVVPYTGKDGSGFQIRSIRPGSIFQRIGLLNFDVIKAVNGKPITTADQAVGLLTMFQNEKEITLDVRRRGREIKMNFIIE
ncbi:MAG: hypothetical protein IIC13_04675 [SAR324 cluster bacterium]|nr:hypothetical protein [SAR324 cluster bacterium]